MNRVAALVCCVSVLAAQSGRNAGLSVSAIRHWSLSDVTRIAVQVSGDFEFRTDRAHNPERVYFDILNSRPNFVGRGEYKLPINDALVTRARVAETIPGVTRVVLDLARPVEIATSQLANPNRLIIEVRAGSGVPAFPEPPVPSVTTPLPTPPAVRPELPKIEPPLPLRPKPSIRAEAPGAESVTAEPSKAQLSKTEPLADHTERESPNAKPDKPKLEKAAADKSPVLPAETGKAAHHTSTGDTSLVRALGLKIGRIVIDPGHGGHDQGTAGPTGLLEKDLVLAVGQRLGKLVEERLGAEVVYTRKDDTFIPLERRTAFANENKADLFISIHANSSPVSRITGVETYYLNFTDSKEALDVASRENASSEKSVFELHDILQEITLHEKAEESHEFASRVQNSLFAFSARTFPNNKNRGVKKAPFVVLIGAHMPSILAEIGFVSNPKEESLLSKQDYRQKLADALFRGIKSYADSLSHFQVAQAAPSR
jgi:N-acetylmuramoyl-L-alanine amidase